MDKILRATAGDGFIKMAVITARDTVQRAREIHNCSPTAAAALGRTLCGASLLGEAMKEENATLTIRVNGGGPIGSVVAVSDHEGYVRGYVENPFVQLPLRADGKLDVGGAVGRDGMLTVSRDIGLREPYIGSTALRSGEIAEDLTAYLLESEQLPSACALGVLVDRDRSIKAAGGFLVQLMPGADEALIEKLEDNIFLMDQLTTVLDEDGPEAVFAQVLKGFEYHVVAEAPVGYRCPCNRERVGMALSVIDEKELREMIEEDKDVEVLCQFCDRRYVFSPVDLREILSGKGLDKGENI
ncbi:MAG: Hsp33 family molecular chaperone HslO [Oscillospiraceae bacterium]|nr:Hsp33 family molecular chaperone HslO [Oscillospiraceae bacterium]